MNGALIHIVANVTARGLSPTPGGFLRRPRYGERLTALKQLAHGRAIVHETTQVGEVAHVIEQALEDDVGLLVLAGGDGTFMSGVSALDRAVRKAQERGRHRPMPRVGLLPLGTVGTIAKNLGEHGDPLALLARWLDAPTEVHALPRPTLRVSTPDAEDRVGFIFGTGLVARFFEVYEAGGAKGIPLAAKIVARVFVESFTGGPLAKQILTPMPCELWIEGERQPAPGFSLLCAAVVRDLGLGMKVCYRAAEEPDRVHLVASSLAPQLLGPRAPYVLMGRSIGGPGHVDRLVRELEVRFPDATGAYVLDGDMFRAKSVRVQKGPIIPIVGPRDA